MAQHNNNVLLNNRSAFTSRNSIDALINYAREQDEKIYTRHKKWTYGKALTIYSFLALPMAYLAYQMTVGYWRNIYHTSLISTPIEAIEGNLREYFVPEMYLKERQIRKIQLGLKDTDQLRTLFRKKPQA